jgi:hypothetical protein
MIENSMFKPKTPRNPTHKVIVFKKMCSEKKIDEKVEPVVSEMLRGIIDNALATLPSERSLHDDKVAPTHRP